MSLKYCKDELFDKIRRKLQTCESGNLVSITLHTRYLNKITSKNRTNIKFTMNANTTYMSHSK